MAGGWIFLILLTSVFIYFFPLKIISTRNTFRALLAQVVGGRHYAILVRSNTESSTCMLIAASVDARLYSASLTDSLAAAILDMAERNSRSSCVARASCAARRRRVGSCGVKVFMMFPWLIFF